MEPNSYIIRRQQNSAEDQSGVGEVKRMSGKCFRLGIELEEASKKGEKRGRTQRDELVILHFFVPIITSLCNSASREITGAVIIF